MQAAAAISSIECQKPGSKCACSMRVELSTIKEQTTLQRAHTSSSRA
jgi:hypothetical protein